MSVGELNDFVSMVQHGDLSISNVIWNNSQINVIDFDTINIYPALWDFFRLAMDVPKLLIMFFTDTFDGLILDIFNHSEEMNKSVIYIKDKYLSVFLEACPWDISIFKEILPDYFLFSRKVFHRRNDSK